MAAYKIFKILDRKPKIILDDPTKKIASNLEGSIEFKNISFAYPTRPGNKILDNISLSIKKNSKVALVGESGCKNIIFIFINTMKEYRKL